MDSRKFVYSLSSLYYVIVMKPHVSGLFQHPRCALFREFKISPPFQSPKDIFCLRMNRTVDSYRKISINNLQFKVHADPRKEVNLRIYPLNEEISEIRFWCEGKLIDVQKAKISDLKGVHF